MKRFWKFLSEKAWLIGFALLALPALPHNGEGQAFPVMLVARDVRTRLATEWEPDNPFQHERGYCVEFSTDYRFPLFRQPLVVYTLSKVTRADERETSPDGIGSAKCDGIKGAWVFLHTHPPTQCLGKDDTSCQVGGEYAYQCFPSDVDMRTLNRSDKPFALIQCDQSALVPYWRTAPLPLVDSLPPTGHR